MANANDGASLPRLLAIDKTFSKLKDQLAEARRLLQIQSHVETNNAGRLELLVKWLLEKLQASSRFRACPQAWELMQDIVRRLPRSTLINIEDALLLALSENYPETLLFEDLKAFELTDGENGLNVPGRTPPQLAGHKRKRSELEPGKPGSDDQTALFSQLFLVFQVFQDRARSVERRITSRYRPDKWLACTKIESCTTFIKHWTIATVHALKLGHKIGDFVSAMDQFWQMQELHFGSSADLFATDCFPALSLLLTLLTRSDKRHSHAINHIGVLERMIDQNVLRIARASCQKPKNPESSSIDSDRSSVQQLSQVVSSLYDKEREANMTQGVQTTWPWSFTALSVLFDLALRGSSLRTVAQRRHEQEWVDELCLALLPTSILNVAPSHKVFATMTAAQLVTICKSYQMVLSRRVLDAILQHFSAMSTVAFEPEQTDLPRTPLAALASQILDMDANLFTDADSPYIQSLLDGMTTAGLMTKEDPHTASSFWNARLAIPLLGDFARSRRLGPYLQHWRKCLEALSWNLPGDRGNGKGSGRRCMSVWTDKRLRDALVDVLEPSLTTEQIQQVITASLDSLDVLVADGDDAPIRAAASHIVLLHAVVGALTNDSVIDSLQPLLMRLITTLNESCTQILEWSVDDELATYFWSLLCRAHRRCWQLTTEVELVSAALHSHSFQAAWTRLSKISKHTEREIKAMLEYVLLICDLNARNADSRDDCRLCLLQLWTDPKTWDGMKRDKQAPNAQPGKQKNSVVAKQPLALANALLATTSVWTLIPKDSMKSLLESLDVENGEAESTGSREAIASSVVSAWSERHGMATDAKFSSLRPSASSSRDTAHVKKSEWQQLESHLARLALDKRQGKLADDVHTMSAIASRADELSVSGKEFDDRDCYSLFLRQCRTLFATRAALKNATPWLEDYGKKLRKMLKSEDLSEHGYKLVMWILLKEACNGNGSIDASIVKLVGKLSEHKAHSGSVSILFPTYRAIACLPIGYWSTDGIGTPSHHGQTMDVAKQIVERFIDEVQDTGTGATGSRIEALDSDTTAGLFERYCHTASHQQVVSAALSLVNRNLDPRANAALLNVLSSIFGRFDREVLKRTIDQLLTSAPAESKTRDPESRRPQIGLGPAVYTLLALALQSVQRPAVEDRQDDNSAIFPGLMELWSRCTDSLELVALTKCVTLILREKEFLVDQFSMEMLLVNLQRTVSPSCPVATDSSHRPACPSAIFLGLCSVTQAVLQSHRRSLGGRAHLFVPLLTQMLACFFTLHTDDDGRAIRHPSWLTRPLTLVHARRFARLLTLLCDPPRASIVRPRHGRSAETGLVDRVRRSRIETSHHVHNLLHAYVRFQLHGRLSGGVKEALEPGVSAVIQLLDMDSAIRKGKGGARCTDGRVRALGACMGKSELALLRREWETWKAVHGTWKG